MNDYKELLYDLDVWQKDAENSELTPPNVLRKCRFAIEQLVKERDAAVQDLFEEADSRLNTCLYCKKDADCVLDCDNALWEWRGVQNGY